MATVALTECNRLMPALDCGLYQDPRQIQAVAEEGLRREVPGARAADAWAGNRNRPVLLPEATWGGIEALAHSPGWRGVVPG